MIRATNSVQRVPGLKVTMAVVNGVPLRHFNNKETLRKIEGLQVRVSWYTRIQLNLGKEKWQDFGKTLKAMDFKSCDKLDFKRTRNIQKAVTGLSFVGGVSLAWIGWSVSAALLLGTAAFSFLQVKRVKKFDKFFESSEYEYYRSIMAVDHADSGGSAGRQGEQV